MLRQPAVLVALVSLGGIPTPCVFSRRRCTRRSRAGRLRAAAPWRAALAAAVVVALLLAGSPDVRAIDWPVDIDQYGHTAWKVRGGALKDSVAAITQTADGYLWLGTQFGLLRSDGLRHVGWQPPAGQHLPSINIRALFGDSDGRLWIGTQLGLASWNNGTLTLHPEVPAQVGGIIEDREGTVWAGTRYPPPGRVCAFRTEAVRCYGSSGEFGSRASSLYEDHAGNLWVGSETGLWRWKPGDPRHYELGDFESSEGLSETDDGAFLIAERGGLKQLIDGSVVEYQLSEAVHAFQPSRLLRDRRGALWIGTFDRGLVHMREGRVSTFSQANGLSGNYIRDIFEDREGNIWVATDNGLDRFRRTPITTVSVSQGLSHTTPWSVLAASDGSVWVGTLDGLNRMKDGRITIYRTTAAGSGSTAAASDDDAVPLAGRSRVSNRALPARGVREITGVGLPDDLIHSLFEDERRRIWVSTRGGTAYFDGDRFHPLAGVPGGVHAMAGDGAGGMFISTDDGLVQVVGGRVGASIPWTSLGRRVPAIAMGTDTAAGGVWLAFRDGTGVAHFKGGVIAASYGAAEGLGRGMVGDLYLETDGTVWASTEGGLSRIRNGRVHTLTANQGLPCDPVHWAIEGDDQMFWLYTACGLARIARAQVDAWATAMDEGRDAPVHVHPTVFDSSDGVRVHAAPGGYSPQVGKSPDGRIWFLPWDGVSVIDPRRLSVNQLPPPVHIEQITADGNSFAPSQGVQLPPLARNLTIDYTALNLSAPERVRFRYQLEGQDPDWREVVNDRRVQYSNLGPGSYRFRVVASNNSGVWNEQGAMLEFAIAPAYYQTTWFRALSVGVVLLTLGGAYGLRVRQLRHAERRSREVVDSIPAIAGIARADGSNEYLNRRWVEFTGLPAVGEAGSFWHVAVHPADRERYDAAWQAALARGEPFEVEARFRSAGGSYRWFLVRAVQAHDTRGRVRNWYGLMTDIERRRDAERDLQQLSGRLIHAQEEERSRIARELHDDISQSLGLLAIKIDQLKADRATPDAVAQALDTLKGDATEVATDVHRLSHQLHSSTLEYLGLEPALTRLVAEVTQRHGIDVELVHQSLPPALPPGVALCLFRVVQEGLNNVARHSHARSAQVRLSGTAEGIRLTIEDDGAGFPLADLERHEGLGFVSMRERLRLLHGTLRVDSAPGRGTRLDICVPAESADTP